MFPRKCRLILQGFPRKWKLVRSLGCNYSKQVCSSLNVVMALDLFVRWQALQSAINSLRFMPGKDPAAGNKLGVLMCAVLKRITPHTLAM